MALAFVVYPQVAAAAGRPDDLQKEWQECRSIIGRFDSTLVDLRKYGLGLASGLLTANGVLGGLANLLPKPSAGAVGFTVPSPVIAALVAVTMVLIVGLFVVDRYYSVLQWGATNRARGLERTLSLNVTGEMLMWSRRRKLWGAVALIQYGSFIVVAVALGIATMGRDAIPSQEHVAADLMWLAFILSLASVLVLYVGAKVEWDTLSQDPPGVVRGLEMVTVRVANPQPAKAMTTAEQELLVKPPFAQDRIALAVVKPTDQPGLSIVGCRIIAPQLLGITFSNDTARDIPLRTEDYQVFVFA